jgi:hypothetical protein
MTTELFHIYTRVPVFRGHRDVGLAWFVWGRPAPTNRPYRELVERETVNTYGGPPMTIDMLDDNHWLYLSGAIAELFSGDEAAAWVAWLLEHRKGEHTVEPAKLPMPLNMMGVGAQAVGGETDFLMMWTSPDYDLPFQVAGYYDLRQHELIEQEAEAQ